jgi:hypothetical protein
MQRKRQAKAIADRRENTSGLLNDLINRAAPTRDVTHYRNWAQYMPRRTSSSHTLRFSTAPTPGIPGFRSGMTVACFQSPYYLIAPINISSTVLQLKVLP